MVVTSGHARPAQPVDELVAELRMLIEALLEYVEPWLQAGSTPSSASAVTEGRWCPLCAVAAAVRGEHPDLPPWFTEHGPGWLSAVRAVLAEHDHRGVTATGAAEPPVPAARVQRITVRKGQCPAGSAGGEYSGCGGYS